jgi:riboflavin kinase / FMN adenylyltransferase
MKVINWTDFLRNGIFGKKGAAITIGVFDGLHIGHQRLVQSILSFSSESSTAATAVFTFTNNPSAFFHPRGFLGNILTVRQKLGLFSVYGLDYAVLIDFSAEFSKLTGHEFFSIIGEHIEIEYVCLGKNFHCGRNNDTHSEEVKKKLGAEGKKVEIIRQVPYKNEPVSSTRIRRELLSGNMYDVNNMLGKRYELDCTEGTENIRQILPADGAYTVAVKGAAEDEQTEEITIKNKKLIFPGNHVEIKTIQFIDRVMK